MEMQSNSGSRVATPVSSEEELCQRCSRPSGAFTMYKGLCHTCHSGFNVWKKRYRPEGTVSEYIEAKPFSGARGVQCSSENSAVRRVSRVKCRACGNKGVLSQDRTLCPSCDTLFVKMETALGRELAMEEFLSSKNGEGGSVMLASSPKGAMFHPSPVSSGELISGFVIAGQEMLSVAKMVEKVAATDASVCIFGETGTGKELVARAVHELSPRQKQPFVIVDCTSLGHEISESELFGHTRGAFTGAHADTLGLFAAAHTGTAFFDELSALDPGIQPKLLRVLEQRHFRPVGKTDYRSVDIRVIAATNQPLEKLVASGGFREDLYHRFNVFPIVVPPLRERKKDILILARYLLNQLEAPLAQLSQEVEGIFLRYSWPGNVRELKNVLTRALIMKDSERQDIEPRDLPLELLQPPQMFLVM